MANLVPVGIYRAVAVPVQLEDGESYVQFGETKEGKPQVAVCFAILDGPCQGRRLTWYGFFTEKTVERTIQSLRYCGFKGDDLALLVTQKLTQEVSVTVGHNTYEGKTTARVDWVNAPGGVKLERPMNKDQIRRFGAQLKAKVKAIAEVAGPAADVPAPSFGEPTEAPSEGHAPPSGWAENAPPPQDDSDIPF
jgi:hypothetical protein